MFEKKNNTFILSKETHEVEIGDIKQPDFYPQVKTKHWDNECNFSVRLKEEDYTADVKEKNGVVEWTKGIKKARFYEVNEYENGGFEFEVEFSEKPESNVVEFTINTKGLEFYYQPELTEEDKANGMNRPENVVGSYAVYHESKRDNNYKTGKAFHIYRPFVIDQKGNKEWCGMTIDKAAGLLVITMPQQFLDNAAYPIILDPTFGYTSAGASTSSTNVYKGRTTTKYQNGTGGVVTSIYGYLNNTSGVSANIVGLQIIMASASPDGSTLDTYFVFPDETAPHPQYPTGSTGWFKIDTINDGIYFFTREAKPVRYGILIETGSPSINFYFDTVSNPNNQESKSYPGIDVIFFPTSIGYNGIQSGGGSGFLFSIYVDYNLLYNSGIKTLNSSKTLTSSKTLATSRALRT